MENPKRGGGLPLEKNSQMILKKNWTRTLSKMAHRVSHSKFWDQFCIQTGPKNLQNTPKADLQTSFWPFSAFFPGFILTLYKPSWIQCYVLIGQVLTLGPKISHGPRPTCMQRVDFLHPGYISGLLFCQHAWQLWKRQGQVDTRGTSFKYFWMHSLQKMLMHPSEIFLDASISNILDASIWNIFGWILCKSSGEALRTSLPCSAGWDQGGMRKKQGCLSIDI